MVHVNKILNVYVAFRYRLMQRRRGNCGAATEDRNSRDFTGRREPLSG